jgi:chromosome segregation ATPase
MGQDQGQVGAAVESGQQSPEEIRREIADTREELGDTAAALAAKTDLKARAKDKVEGVKQTIAEKKESMRSSTDSSADGGGATTQANAVMAQVKTKAQANPIPTAAIAAFVGGFLFGRITAR